MHAEQISLGIEHLLYAEKQMDEAAIFTYPWFLSAHAKPKCI